MVCLFGFDVGILLAVYGVVLFWLWLLVFCCLDFYLLCLLVVSVI